MFLILPAEINFFYILRLFIFHILIKFLKRYANYANINCKYFKASAEFLNNLIYLFSVKQ